MLKAIKIRLYPNKEQERYIKTLLGSYRFVYNQCLDKKIKSYTNDKKNLGLKELGNFFHQELTKNNEFQWLNEHNTKVLKQSVIDLLDSYKRFFVNSNGFPKFKSKHDNKQSCRFPLESISKRNVYSEYKLTLSNIKNIKFKCSENYVKYLDKNKEKIKSATLSKTKSDKYFLSILIDGDFVEKNNKPKNEFIGLDLGIKSFVVDSNGNTYENIKIKRNNEKKLNKLHKELSRKQKGSNNRNKLRLKLAKLYEKLNNKKENYLHSITNQLINENQVIIIENLNVKGMMKNHNLAKSIQELSLYRFKEMLRYKSVWYGNYIVEIDKFYPSSKLCSVCGHKNNDLKLSEREWKCNDCGSVHDRDKNAAINILNEGMKLYKNKIPTRCGESTPLESSDNTLDELGNRDLHNFV